MVSRRVYRRSKRKPRKKRWPVILLVLISLAGLGLGASVAIGFNPFLEGSLRAQFGDAFFSDFGVRVEKKGGDDLDSIISAYEPAFEELEDKSLERLGGLYEAALADYYEEEQQGTVDRFMLTNKYIQAGRMLEKNVDQVFYELLEEMEADLKAGGLSLDVLEEIEATYTQAKADKKRQLLQRLRQEIGS